MPAPDSLIISSSLALALFLGLQDAPRAANGSGAVQDQSEPNPFLCQSPSFRNPVRPHPCSAVILPAHEGVAPDTRSLTCVDSKWLGCFFKHRKVLIFFYENKKQKVILYPRNHQCSKTYGMSNSRHGLANPKVATVQNELGEGRRITTKGEDCSRLLPQMTSPLGLRCCQSLDPSAGGWGWRAGCPSQKIQEQA